MSSRLPLKYTDPSSIHRLLLCTVCQQPMTDPVRNQANQQGCRKCFTSSDEKAGDALTPIVEVLLVEMLNDLHIRCPHCDESGIKRGDLAQHETEGCPAATVACESADLKCPWKGPRQSLGQHMRECLYAPLRPVLKYIIEENQRLRDELVQLEVQFDSLSNNNGELSRADEELLGLIDRCAYQGIVNLPSKKITDEQIKIVVKYAVERKQCKTLDLNSNQITCNGVRRLADCLMNNRTLEKLYITTNQISDDGAAALARVLTQENCKLQELALESNQITDQGVQSLAGVLPTNTTLTYLGLSANRIENDGVRFLCQALAQNSHLQELHLNGNDGITDECINDLKVLLRQNKSIRRLTMIGCGFSVDGRTKLGKLAQDKKQFHLSV